jgi:hypothetical protein
LETPPEVNCPIFSVHIDENAESVPDDRQACLSSTKLRFDE